MYVLCLSSNGKVCVHLCKIGSYDRAIFVKVHPLTIKVCARKIMSPHGVQKNRCLCVKLPLHGGHRPHIVLPDVMLECVNVLAAIGFVAHG